MAQRLHENTSNVSNEVIAGFAIEADRAQREIDEASGRKRAVMKRAKAAGVNTKALLSALAFKRQDEEVVKLEVRDTIRYANIIAPQVPLKQTDLFDGAADRPLNTKTQGQVQAWEAEQKGYDCGLNGGSMDDAVYAPGTPAYGHFATGYERGQAVIAERMGEHAKQADAGLTKRRGRGKAQAAGEDLAETQSVCGRDDGGVGEPMGNA